jgi:hypothetical protein
LREALTMHDYAIAQLEEALAKTEREHAVLVEAVAQGTRVLQAALRVEAAQAIPWTTTRLRIS